MKFISILVFIAINCTPEIKSSNILIFVPSPWKSHIVSFEPLFLELAHRGHNVTVVSKFAVKNPPLNYTQIVPKYKMDFGSVSDIVMQDRNKYLFFFDEIYMRNVIGINITKNYVSDPVVQKFIKEDQTKFDLVIIESFFQDCTVAMGHKYGAPVISIIPVAPFFTVSRHAANPSDFSYIKDFKLNAGKSLDFQKQIMDTYFQYPGYENRPTMTEMLENISLSLIDSDVAILSPRPYVPNFIEIPGIHIQPTKKMCETLQNFMNTATAGVVYLNFGTILDVARLPKPSLEVLVNVLGRLEQKVLFKWTNNDTQGFPNNFYVDSWFPQLNILRHPNCKLFITHGGVHGIMETIDAGIPFIGFPIFGDQFQNLKISQENGFGIISNIHTLSEETFERDVKLILTDTRFTENAKRMSTIFHDRPMSALDTAVYWVEYVIRHKGAHHLRSTAVKLTWYQYLLLDVILFFIIIALLLIYICYFITKCIMRSILKLFIKQKTD
ncbi:UDP-glucuronosyltransferase 2B7-like isoform X2 [Rhopalosiphum maidis]|uniref:UDP-glucuronosyltransferase 2B7-like isoform X2 n=1 Tax=Rhopalosiphum maidis TaxID=43146 RepID=UPI000F00F872|nr:UDP-glucuronosyltransferase 2B7-like isoform X2 [Rhopalosiphum maidis]